MGGSCAFGVARDLTGHITIFREFDWTEKLKLVNISTFHNLTIYRFVA